MVSQTTFTILSAITCILALVSVGLTASHSMSHSSIKYKSSGLTVKTMGNIPDCPSAVKVKVDDDDMEIVISCPYKPATKAIALISLIALQILLILLCCKLKNRVKSVIIIVFAIIEFPLLFVGGILMIADMVSGKKKLSDMSNYSYQPFEYVINVLFLFFALICGAVVTYFAYSNRPPTHPSSKGNTTMSVTQPHWGEEGESRSQTADYIKPHQQGNISTYRDYRDNRDYQGHPSQAYPYSNNANTSVSSPNGKGQPYQPQNDRYRRNGSYEENLPQDRPRQQSNTNDFNYGGNQQNNNGYNNNGSNSHRAKNLTIETNNANQSNYNGNQNYSNHYAHQNNFSNVNQNNSMARAPNRGTRNQSHIIPAHSNNNNPHNNTASYERGPERSPQRNNQSQMYSNNNNNNNGTVSYERGPERSPQRDNGRSPDNRNGGGQNKFSSALNRIGAINAFENGSNNRGYLNYGNEPNYQGNTDNYDDGSLDIYRNENRGRNQNNYDEGNYQRGNQRRGSQDNGNNLPYNNNNGNNGPYNNNGMRRSPSQSYGGYAFS